VRAVAEDEVSITLENTEEEVEEEITEDEVVIILENTEEEVEEEITEDEVSIILENSEEEVEEEITEDEAEVTILVTKQIKIVAQNNTKKIRMEASQRILTKIKYQKKT
jgi:hypothetical protein